MGDYAIVNLLDIDVVRAFEAGPEGLELIAVGGPKPEGGAGVRSESPWPGEG